MQFFKIDKDFKYFEEKRLPQDTTELRLYDIIDSARYSSCVKNLFQKLKLKMSGNDLRTFEGAKVSREDEAFIFEIRKSEAEETQLRRVEINKLDNNSLKTLAYNARLNYEYVIEEAHYPSFFSSKDEYLRYAMFNKIERDANMAVIDEIVDVCYSRIESGECSLDDFSTFTPCALRGLKTKIEQQSSLKI